MLLKIIYNILTQRCNRGIVLSTRFGLIPLL